MTQDGRTRIANGGQVLAPAYPERIGIRVIGRPVTQGNHRQTRYGKSYETTKGHKEWRETVRLVAVDQCRYYDTLTGPLKAWVRFTFTRPLSHYYTGRNAHLLRPDAPAYPKADVDKLVRAVFDSLTDAGVWADDSQVVDVRARKFWAGEHELALQHLDGADVVIEQTT